MTSGSRHPFGRIVAATALGPIGAGLGPISSGPALGGGLDAVVAAALLGTALVAVGLALLARAVARWRRRRRSAAERSQRIAQLATEANRLIIEADDAVREAGQDLGFAEAQFEEADVAPLRTVVATAEAELRAAFGVRQRFDEAPGDAATQAATLGEIVGRSRRILDSLNAERTRIDGLRERDREAPEILARLAGRIAAFEGRLPAVEVAIARLEAYAPAGWDAVRTNVEEARGRLADSETETERGMTALAAKPTDMSSAARSARRAIGALAEAGTLLDNVENLLAELDDARARVASEVEAAGRDLEAAKLSMSGECPVDPGLAAGIAEAEGLLARAKTAASGDHPDPVAGLRAARQARADVVAVLASARTVADREARRAAAAATALRSAEMSIGRANDYIATRSDVGGEARTRLLEAQQRYDQAMSLAVADVERATRAARTADRLGDEAYGLARSDADRWDRRHDSPIDPGAVILAGIVGSRRGCGSPGGAWRGTLGRSGSLHGGDGRDDRGGDGEGGC